MELIFLFSVGFSIGEAGIPDPVWHEKANILKAPKIFPALRAGLDCLEIGGRRTFGWSGNFVMIVSRAASRAEMERGGVRRRNT